MQKNKTKQNPSTTPPKIRRLFGLVNNFNKGDEQHPLEERENKDQDTQNLITKRRARVIQDPTHALKTATTGQQIQNQTAST